MRHIEKSSSFFIMVKHFWVSAAKLRLIYEKTNFFLSFLLFFLSHSRKDKRKAAADKSHTGNRRH